MAPHHYPLPVLQHPRRNHYAPISVKFIRNANEFATHKPHPRRTDVRHRARSAEPMRFVRSEKIFLAMVFCKIYPERKRVCYAQTSPSTYRRTPSGRIATIECFVRKNIKLSVSFTQSAVHISFGIALSGIVTLVIEFFTLANAQLDFHVASFKIQ